MKKQKDISFFKDEIKKTKNLHERIRLCALLANANGHSIKAIAAVLRISESCVNDYLTEFQNEKKSIKTSEEN